MRRFALPSLGVTVLLAGSLALVSSAAYASTSATAPQTLAVQPGTIFVSNTTPANITAPVDGSGSGTLPTALWGDTTGTGDGWQGSVAASNFVYTGQWTPTGSAPALGSSSSASYTGSADGDTYTVSVTGVSGSTINFSYSSQNGATGTGTATAGTAANVGTNGLTITFSSSTTYSTGDEYQIQVGSQNKNALALDNGSTLASVYSYGGATSPEPALLNTNAAVTGGGNTYGSAVPFLSAAINGGMGEYTVTPAASVNTDINSWAATYTGNIQYTISSGPAPGAPSFATASTTTSSGTLISTQDFTYNGSLQTISVPSGAKYAVITAAGAGGGGGSDDDNTYGGSGDLIQANVALSTNQLNVLVGGGGQTSSAGSGGGGGLSGVFDGTPSSATALVVAGGGGGGANDGVENTQSNGTNGSLNPTVPLVNSDGLYGGSGYGGGGTGNLGDSVPGTGNPNASVDGTAFGAGGTEVGGNCSISGIGGYGGGGSGGCQWGGGGGGSGYVGGQGGNSWSGFGTPTGSGGEGGQSYAINTATHVVDTPGNGGAGGLGANGGNGYVDISFYS